MKRYFCLLLLLFSALSFAQTDSSDDSGVEVEIGKTASSSNSDAIKIDPRTVDPKLLDQLQKFQKDNEQFFQQAEKHKGDPTFLFRQMMKDTGKKGGLFGKGDLKEFLSGALIPFRVLPEAQVSSLLLKKTEGTFFYDFLLDYPKVLKFMVKMLRDEVAIPVYALIIKDKVRLATFLIINVVIIIINWLLRRYAGLRPRAILEALQLWFMRFLLITGARLIVLIFFFHVELGPTWRIFLDVFF